MKVFISGPMSGKPNGNKEAFFKAQKDLERNGYSVWNPAWLAYPSDTEFSKEAMHAIDNEALRHCDAIYMLKGWTHSDGALNELRIARARELTIMYESDCCWGKEPEKNTPVFDREFAYNEAIKNRTNYQLEAIKWNIRAKYAELKEITENLDIGLGNESDRINSLEGEVEAIKESIGTDNLKEQLEKDFADVYTEFQNTKDKVNDIEFGYIDWSSKMSSAIDEMEKVRDTVKGLNSLVATLDAYKEAYKQLSTSLDNNDNALERRIKALENSVYDIRCIVNSSDIETISIKAMNQRLIDLGRELDDYIDDYKEADKALERRINVIEKKQSSFLEGYNSTLTRLKAIEKRLSIKPFYEPTEDEKDD